MHLFETTTTTVVALVLSELRREEKEVGRTTPEHLFTMGRRSSLHATGLPSADEFNQDRATRCDERAFDRWRDTPTGGQAIGRMSDFRPRCLGAATLRLARKPRGGPAAVSLRSAFPHARTPHTHTHTCKRALAYGHHPHGQLVVARPIASRQRQKLHQQQQQQLTLMLKHRGSLQARLNVSHRQCAQAASRHVLIRGHPTGNSDRTT